MALCCLRWLGANSTSQEVFPGRFKILRERDQRHQPIKMHLKLANKNLAQHTEITYLRVLQVTS